MNTPWQAVRLFVCKCLPMGAFGVLVLLQVVQQNEGPLHQTQALKQQPIYIIQAGITVTANAANWCK